MTLAAKKFLKVISIVLVSLICFSCVSDRGASLQPVIGTTIDQDDLDKLSALNEEIFRTMIVERDATLFAEKSSESFRVLAPGGVVEDKAQSVAGLGGWNVKGIRVSGENIAVHGRVATLTGRLDIDGELAPIGRWGPLKYMSTYVFEDDQWTLISRSLTPCLPKVVEIGRC